MLYQEALDYLYHQLPMFSRTGKAAIKPGLKNTIDLCNFLGNPQHQIKTIHVAGTNGKGSVCHMLASIFMENGYKTGLYTSPHLYDFRERIRINGEMVSPGFVVDFVEKTAGYMADHQPSFFELTFGMALDYFAKEQVDIAIIETGLGGRLDSTNIITPELSVITNIGLDHKDILGDTHAKIATEKAGIIKSGIPVVIGEASGETRPVFEKFAIENGSDIFFAQDQFSVLEAEKSDTLLQVDVFDHEEQSKHRFLLDLTAHYQTFNLLTVLTALKVLEEQFSLLPERTQSALSLVRTLTGLRGRWEQMKTEPRVVMDVAHNAEGMRELLHQISLEKYGQLFIILGMVKDKEAGEVLLQLPKNATYFFTNAHIERALPAVELQTKAAEYLLTGEVFSNVNLALEAALQSASADDLVIICGSVFLIAEVDPTLFN